MNIEESTWGTSVPIAIEIYKCTNAKNETVIMKNSKMIRIMANGKQLYEIIDEKKFSENKEIKETLINELSAYINEKAKEKMTIKEIETNLKEKDEFINRLNKKMGEEHGIKFTSFKVNSFKIAEDLKESDFCIEEKTEEQKEVTTIGTIEDTKTPAEESNNSLFTIIGIVIAAIVLIVLLKAIFGKKKPDINNSNNNINTQNNFNDQNNQF